MRKQYINTIIESMHRAKQEVCCKLSKVPGSRITPSEWAALSIVYNLEGINPKALSEKMGVTVSAVSQLLKGLEERKIIKRVIDKKDKRSSHIQLTAKSKNMIKTMEKTVHSGMSEMFTSLSDNELKTLAKLHQKISNTICKK